MRRLLVVAEGQTEQLFAKKLLSGYLRDKGMTNLVQSPVIKTTHGGLLSFSQLENDLNHYLRESDVVVTTMIDFYALPSDFPGYEDAARIVNHKDRVVYLENALRNHFSKGKGFHLDTFVPYIQLHEFETMVFSSKDSFDIFDDSEVERKKLESIVEEYPDPELINDHRETAPSKRLLKLIPGYNKVLYGNQMIERIGLEVVRSKCSHFNEWIEKVMVLL
jgi:hypothetical protein